MMYDRERSDSAIVAWGGPPSTGRSIGPALREAYRPSKSWVLEKFYLSVV